MGNTLSANNLLRHPHLSLMLALGTLGSATLVLSRMFFTRGKYILLTYALIVIATGVILKTNQIRQYFARFWVGLGAFMMANIALYLHIRLIEQSPNLSPLTVWGHTWRLGFMLGIGAALNLALARVTE